MCQPVNAISGLFTVAVSNFRPLLPTRHLISSSIDTQTPSKLSVVSVFCLFSVNMTDPRRNTEYDHLIPTIRNELVKTLKQREYQGLYYDFDLNQALKEDYRVRRFLVINGGHVNNSLKQLINSFVWKKKHRLRELTDSDLPAEFVAVGGAFRYEKDKDGRPTIYLRATHNIGIKDMNPLYELQTYYLALLTDDEAGDLGATYVFDLSNSSVMKHFDFNMAMTLETLRNTLPYFVTHVIAIDLPVLARYGWNIVKYAMPHEVRSVMKTVSRTDVLKYIDRHHLPPFLGGTCIRHHCGLKVVPINAPPLTRYLKHQLRLSDDSIRNIINAITPLLETSRQESESNHFDANGNSITPCR